MTMFECTECKEEFDEMEEDYKDDVQGNMYCEECAGEVLICCDSCDEFVEEDEIKYSRHHDEYICEGCVDDGYVITTCCSDIVREHIAIDTRDNNNYFCDHDCLYNNDNFICYGCGGAYSDNHRGRSTDYDIYCMDCDNGSEHIRDYHDNPPVEFFGEATQDRYFGVELELDDGDNVGFSENINEGTDERLFLMEDSSLSKDGVEVISQPMSYDEHMNGGMWEDVRAEALSHNLRSHDTRTCGLHIHVSKKGMHDKKAVDNIIFIVNRFWNQMTVFSRRDVRELERWAKKSIDKPDEDVKVEDVSKSDKYSRYNAINLNNGATIEFRLFKGSLRVETIKASIQLVDLITRVANMYSENDECINELEWKFIAQLAKDEYELLYDEFVRLELV